MHRIDLADAVLSLKAAGIVDVVGFRWFTPPTVDGLARAEAQLHDLGATDAHGALTAAGRRMAALPLEPRAARLMLAGADHDCASEAAFIAAAIEGEELFVGGKSGSKREDFQQAGDLSDFAADWRAFDAACAVGFDVGRCQNFGVSAGAARERAKAFERLAALAKKAGFPWHPPDFTARGDGVAHAMLAAFSDHLAIRLNQGTLACRMTGNRKGRLDETSCAKSASAFVAAEITEVQAREVVTHLRRATVIDPAWLEAVFPEDLHRHDGAAWDEVRRRVVRRRETRFRDLGIESFESDQNVPPDAAAELLAARVLSGELVLKNWNHEVDQWTSRLVLLGEWMPELGMPGWGADDQAAAIAQICHGAVSYKEIKEAPVWPVLREWLNAAQRHALDHYCPERIALPGSHNARTARITYEAGKPPWFAARVADLFGMWKTPAIADGRVPLLVHILTPGQKSWQMTRDLESFWASGYFQMKKELAGRYPRHPWPEDPKAR
ncbi:MAG: ATP-dependent helicase C-terminal domain-containing protein [Luteolibacter sp.]